MEDKKEKDKSFNDNNFSVEEVAVTENNDGATMTADLSEFSAPVGTQGRKGQKAPRMNLAIPEDVYEYIRRESRKEGMTYSEFICAVMRWRQKSLAE